MSTRDDSTNETIGQMVELLKQQNQTITEILLAQKAEVLGILGTVTETNTMGHVLQHGFSTLSAQLAPLRDLSPRRTPLDPDQFARLDNLRRSLARQEWGDVQGLEVKQLPVPFIGAVPPPAPAATVAELYYVAQAVRDDQEGDPRS